MSIKIETVQDLNGVYNVFESIKDDGTLEDRSEYQPEDLAAMYGLGPTGATNLYRLIQGTFATDTSPWDSLDPVVLKRDVMDEAIHQGLDGWEPHEKVIIELFLQDLQRAYKNL
jgi:hypothetical protein